MRTPILTSKKRAPFSGFRFLRGRRLGLMIILVVSLGLGLIGRAQLPLLNQARFFIVDTMGSFFYTLTRPFHQISHLIDEVYTWRHLRHELEISKKKNLYFKSLENDVHQLRSENILLRQLLKVVPDKIKDHATARVLMSPNTLFSHTLIVAAGSKQGINKGFAVLTEAGVIGRIIDVGEETSRVLLITDYSSRVPVLVESSRDHAILAGNNASSPLLMYAQSAESILPGERIITSGYGGVFPPGLPIGVVKVVSEGIIKVQPVADLNRLEYVRLVCFMPKAVENLQNFDPLKKE